MIRYETLFLTIPEITADEARGIENQLEKVVADAKGTVLSFERWGKYNLAYPVRKYEYGIYFLMRFEIAEEKKDALLASLKTLFAVKYTDLVMRHVIMRLDPYASLEYRRPESLEEAPTRDVDAFLKENKMSGLLSKSAGTAVDSEEEGEVEQLEQ